MRLPLALLAVMVATPAAAQLPPLPEPTYPQPRYAAPVPLPRTVQPVPLPSAVQPVPLPYARPGNDIGTGQSLPLSPNASNITPDDSRSTIAPTLPIPQIGEDAPPAAFLRAARAALQAGRTGEAQEGLERAESLYADPLDPAVAGRPPGAVAVSAAAQRGARRVGAGRPQRGDPLHRPRAGGPGSSDSGVLILRFTQSGQRIAPQRQDGGSRERRLVACATRRREVGTSEGV